MLFSKKATRRLCLDRIEEDVALLQDENEQMWKFPASELPQGTAEGRAVLGHFRGKRLEAVTAFEGEDPEAAEIEALMREITGETVSPGGDANASDSVEHPHDSEKDGNGEASERPQNTEASDFDSRNSEKCDILKTETENN